MPNKNPFEIRAEMLQLAKEYMDQQYQMNVSFAEKAMEEGKKTFEQYQEVVSNMYSMDELMEKAKEMYTKFKKAFDELDPSIRDLDMEVQETSRNLASSLEMPL